MDKFTLKNPNLKKNNKYFTYKYLSFFIFKGKAYPVGSRVELTEQGKSRMHLGHVCDSFKVIECYFNNGKLQLFINGFADNKIVSMRHQVFSDYIDSTIERVISSPMNDNHKEYIDFVNSYQTYASMNNLTREESENIKYASMNHILIEEIDNNLPDKIKRVEDAKRREAMKHKDWEYPEIIIGWIILIVICIFFGVFKGFWNQFILRMIAFVYFMNWREKKKLKS